MLYSIKHKMNECIDQVLLQMHSDSPDMKKKYKYGNENRINLKEYTANVYKVTGIALV